MQYLAFLRDTQEGKKNQSCAVYDHHIYLYLSLSFSFIRSGQVMSPNFAYLSKGGGGGKVNLTPVLGASNLGDWPKPPCSLEFTGCSFY